MAKYVAEVEQTSKFHQPRGRAWRVRIYQVRGGGARAGEYPSEFFKTRAEAEEHAAGLPEALDAAERLASGVLRCSKPIWNGEPGWTCVLNAGHSGSCM